MPDIDYKVFNLGFHQFTFLCTTEKCPDFGPDEHVEGPLAPDLPGRPPGYSMRDGGGCMVGSQVQPD